MTARQRRRVALAVGSVVTAVGMAFTPTASAYSHPHTPAITNASAHLQTHEPTNLPPLLTHYGAIAYSHDGSLGIARRSKSKLLAQQQALQRCGAQTCTVVTTFTKCGAVAHDGVTYHGGTGLTPSAAEAHAVSLLGGGRIVLSICN
ncbi:hypothetical protein A5725_02135 [Mycobacterium kubicae]|uniref:DUF4189 domain-containing protein n=1 Tax=Mycobacterium kubicae TaxID=120959 RepID=UPI0008023146|nr:DUF4189 domain-containing protein [Mycobacterium kubicae]OBF18802.1 hypothetical protein A5725_02135 [Mycobacterium kubicae]